MEKLHLHLTCLPAENRMTDEQISLCKPFLKHTESLVLDWCACTEDAVVDLLTSDDHVNQSVREISFLSKRRFYGCKGKENADSESESDSVIEAVGTFLESCKNVKKIDFGTDALCHNIDIMNIVKKKADQGTLVTLNMSGNYSWLDEIFFSPQDQISTQLSLIKDNLFKTLSELIVNWDDHFENLITTLATSTSRVKTLGLLIEPEKFYDYINIRKTSLTQLWKSLKSNKPEIEVKLNLHQLQFYNDDDLDDIKTVFNSEMPLIRMCVVYKMEEYAQIVLRIMKKEKHGASLKEVGFHKRYHYHFHTLPVKEVHRVSKTITDLKGMKNLRIISWSGEFVLLTDLMSLVTQHIDTLQEINIHKHELVSERAPAAEEEKENQTKRKRKKKIKDYDPLTDSEIYCVEQTVSKMLGKPWSMLKEIPVQMCDVDDDFDFNWI